MKVLVSAVKVYELAVYRIESIDAENAREQNAAVDRLLKETKGFFRWRTPLYTSAQQAYEALRYAGGVRPITDSYAMFFRYGEQREACRSLRNAALLAAHGSDMELDRDDFEKLNPPRDMLPDLPWRTP